MITLTFLDIDRCRRCPLFARLYRAEGSNALTSFECMDQAVRDTILEFGNKRILGRTIKEDEALSAYWDRWDDLSKNIVLRGEDSNLDYIRLGETCIRNFVRIASWKGAKDIVSADMRGKYRLSDDITLNIGIDEVSRTGKNIRITRYITEPVLWSREDLARDLEMSMDALWASENIPGVRKLEVQWIFLSDGTAVQSQIDAFTLEQNRTILLNELGSLLKDDALPRETSDCPYCQYRTQCPRFLHELSLGSPDKMHLDSGVRLVDEYAELTEKMDALESRRKVLEAKRATVMNEIIAFANANDFLAVTGHEHKVLVRHERKVDLPEDKADLVAALRSKGLYDRISMVNYPRLRSEIAKGDADPDIARMAKITRVDKLYLRRKSERNRYRLSL